MTSSISALELAVAMGRASNLESRHLFIKLFSTEMDGTFGGPSEGCNGKIKDYFSDDPGGFARVPVVVEGLPKFVDWNRSCLTQVV
jgi:hypothetical protein